MAPEDTPQGRVGLVYLVWMELMQADPMRDQQHDQDPGHSKQGVNIRPGDQLNQCPFRIPSHRGGDRGERACMRFLCRKPEGTVSA